MRRWYSGIPDPSMGWDAPHAKMIPCPACSGGGGEWFSIDGEATLSPEEFSKLPEEEKKWYRFEPCEACHGEGEVEDEWWAVIDESRKYEFD